MMKKINSNSTTRETSEIGDLLVTLNTKNPIAEDTYWRLTNQKLSVVSADLTEEINSGQLRSDLKEKDALRDLDIRAIFYTVEACTIRRPGEDQEKSNVPYGGAQSLWHEHYGRRLRG